jgi:uncharacterized protein
MLKIFYPNFIFDEIQDISYDFLKKQRIKAIMVDMDNTLVDYKYKYNKLLKTWIKDVKKLGIKICIVSNTPRKNKVKMIARELSINYIYNAMKPWSYGFKKALEIIGEEKQNVAIIGDQIFTDIYGGNRFGIKTILVNPVEKKEYIGTKIKRPIERLIIKKYKESLKVK